jgi:Glycosyl hydrolase family 47
MYVMWKTTKNPIWRERNWEIFRNLLQWTRVKNGFATLFQADAPQSGFKNSMPRFAHCHLNLIERQPDYDSQLFPCRDLKVSLLDIH